MYAFVTFNKAIERDRVIDAYTKLSFYTWWCNNSHLRLYNNFLHVQRAPEPSVILWENLGYNWMDRTCRRILTTLGSFLLIFISLSMIFAAKYLKQSVGNSIVTEDDLCPEAFATWDKGTQQAYIDEHSNQLHCYCDQFTSTQQANDSYCRKYVQRNMSAQTLVYFASFMVLVVNTLIEKAMRVSSAFEKHHTSDGQRMSIFIRLFVLKYINTAAVFFINNNNILTRTLFGVELESTTEFTTDWFNVNGVTIILVQLGDIFNAHSDHIYNFVLFKRQQWKLIKDPSLALTQNELNKAFLGPKFEFAYSYAQLMSTIFVCLTFSSGIPLLYAISAANYGLFYLVEKYLMIHCYRTPPQYNTHVGKAATSLIPLALLIHMAMSVWVLSNNSLFVSDISRTDIAESSIVFGNTIRDKITYETTLPLFLLFCIIVILRFLMIFYKRGTSVYEKVSIYVHIYVLLTH